MKLPYYRINAFYDDACANPIRSGNPAAVVLLTTEQNMKLSDTKRQLLAAELNLSETSFVTQTSQKNRFNLRWFTPNSEVSLCGHATLAAAAAVRSANWVKVNKDKKKESEITFMTLSGELVVTRCDDDMLSMKFPALCDREEIQDESFKLQLYKAMKISNVDDIVKDIFQSKFDIVIEINTEDNVKQIQPDFKQLKQLPMRRGLIVCSNGRLSNKTHTFVSRFFAPAFGIDEDAVTGSAHCTLIPMYLNIGQQGIAYQFSNIRSGGKLFVEYTNEDFVLISGKSFLVIQGVINLNI